MALMLVYLINLEDYNGLLGPGSMVTAAIAINRWPISQRERDGTVGLIGRKHEHTTTIMLRRGSAKRRCPPPHTNIRSGAINTRKTRFVMRPSATTSQTRGTREGAQREAKEQEECGQKQELNKFRRLFNKQPHKRQNLIYKICNFSQLNVLEHSKI